MDERTDEDPQAIQKIRLETFLRAIEKASRGGATVQLPSSSAELLVEAGFAILGIDLEEDQPEAPKTPRKVIMASGHYTGSFCVHCSSSRMIRTGTCETCLECGETRGCS